VTTIQKSFAFAGVVVVLAVIGVLVLGRQHGPIFAKAPPVAAQKTESKPTAAPVGQALAPAAETTAASAQPRMVADVCAAPSGMPPRAPDGTTATEAQMHAAHEAIQAYVDQLETYQACRNHEADAAGNTVPEAQKQAWIEMGNGAVDEANLLAAAFAAQTAAYRTAHPAGK
jgi:Tfp pilus assembly major pilin PilA